MADGFADRMKEYEAASEAVLPKRIPLIMRLDGRAFSTLTRQCKFKKPFDANFHATMVKITATLCSKIQNARFGYTQSDEISILLYPKTTNAGNEDDVSWGYMEKNEAISCAKRNGKRLKILPERLRRKSRAKK